MAKLTVNDSIKGKGQDLYTAIPEDIADANRALSESLQQIKDVFNLDAQQLATVTKELETLKGLDKLQSLKGGIPQEVLDFWRDTYGEGSGQNGEFLITDVIGTVAGFVHNDELPLVAGDVKNLNDQGALDYLNECYQALRDLFDGEFTYTSVSTNPTPPPSTITTYYYIIPSGTTNIGNNSIQYGSMNAAADAIMGEIESELATLASTYPEQAQRSINSFTNMANQVKREKENMVKAGIDPTTTQTGVKSPVIGLVKNLHDYAKDDSLGGSAWILENVADTNTLYGQAVVASLREGRNIKRLDDAGIGNAIFVQGQTRTQEKASLADSTYSVDEATRDL